MGMIGFFFSSVSLVEDEAMAAVVLLILFFYKVIDMNDRTSRVCRELSISKLMIYDAKEFQCETI